MSCMWFQNLNKICHHIHTCGPIFSRSSPLVLYFNNNSLGWEYCEKPCCPVASRCHTSGLDRNSRLRAVCFTATMKFPIVVRNSLLLQQLSRCLLRLLLSQLLLQLWCWWMMLMMIVDFEHLQWHPRVPCWHK